MQLGQAVRGYYGREYRHDGDGFHDCNQAESDCPVGFFTGVIIMMFCKKNFQKHIGQIVTGFGILFFGMTLMSTAMDPLSESEFSSI